MPTLLTTAASGLVAGTGATVVKSWSEGALRGLADRLLPPSPQEAARPGADPQDRPEDMPPALLVARAERARTGEQPDAEERTRAAAPLHWVMGIGSAVAYAVLSDRVPAVRAGLGAPAGLALFAATHGSTLPAAGVQAPVRDLPRSWWVWEAGSHAAYAVALELLLKVARALTR